MMLIAKNTFIFRLTINLQNATLGVHSCLSNNGLYSSNNNEFRLPRQLTCRLHPVAALRYKHDCAGFLIDDLWLQLPTHKYIDDVTTISETIATCSQLLTVAILQITTQQCRNYLYDKSWPNQWYEQQQQRPFNGLWSGTTRVGQYQKKHSPTHTHPDHRASFITFLHLQRSIASSLFNLRAWQSSRTTSFQVFFGLPLGLKPLTSCSIHFFTQSSSSFRNTWPYQRSLFCCNINAMS